MGGRGFGGGPQGFSPNDRSVHASRSLRLPELCGLVALRGVGGCWRYDPLRYVRPELQGGQMVRKVLPESLRKPFPKARMPALQKHELGQGETGQVEFSRSLSATVQGLLRSLGGEEVNQSATPK